MNRLSIEKRAAIIGALVEGNSIRATCRMTGAAKGTVTKLLVDMGYACMAHHDRTVRGLKSERVQCDEIWSFCFAKQKNVQPDKVGAGLRRRLRGPRSTPTSKQLVSYYIGKRETRGCRRRSSATSPSVCSDRVQLFHDRSVTLAVPRSDPAQSFGPGVEPRSGCSGTTARHADEGGSRIIEPARLSAPESPCRDPRRQPRAGRDRHELRRAVEPDRADGDAPLRAPAPIAHSKKRSKTSTLRRGAALRLPRRSCAPVAEALEQAPRAAPPSSSARAASPPSSACSRSRRPRRPARHGHRARARPRAGRNLTRSAGAAIRAGRTCGSRQPALHFLAWSARRALTGRLPAIDRSSSRSSRPGCASATRTSRSSRSCAHARNGSAARRRCASSRPTRRRPCIRRP